MPSIRPHLPHIPGPERADEVLYLYSGYKVVPIRDARGLYALTELSLRERILGLSMFPSFLPTGSCTVGDRTAPQPFAYY